MALKNRDAASIYNSWEQCLEQPEREARRQCLIRDSALVCVSWPWLLPASHKESSALFGAELTELWGNTENKAGGTELKALLLPLASRDHCPAHGAPKCTLTPRGRNGSTVSVGSFVLFSQQR